MIEDENFSGWKHLQTARFELKLEFDTIFGTFYEAKGRFLVLDQHLEDIKEI